ncbi:DNA recombination protein RmuC [Gilvimarinus sp. DA14]|uniref:DNA recombination protein RmuC n=1 Tax=Gilvimarinus sp. DA14 TaxID=2956798 RepID=UPI0020B7454A|nr:DNA recombination protein RmuC [Gilvimarinus sp. DA14]UTF60724.1 DNA recombination protein RmuC [Gilvimarinus sp. DA14]
MIQELLALSTLALLSIAAASALLGALVVSVYAAFKLRARETEMNTALTDQAHQHKLQKTQLEAQLDHSETELQEQKLNITRLEQSRDELNRKLSEQMSLNSGLKERLTHFETLKSEQQALESQVVRLSEQRSQLSTQLEAERDKLKAQESLLEQTRQELKKEFELTANKLFEQKSAQFNSTSQSLLEGALSPFKAQLSDFRKKVEDVYEKENAERNRLSGQIQELQKQAHKIGEDAVNLAQALKGNSKAQGGWGEIVLERLLEQSGLQKGREYETQLSFTSETGARRMPDVVVRLPEGKDIVIDAKVSLTDYERYCSSDDEGERQKYLQAHIQSVRNHIKGLSAKDYENLPGLRALDFVFIFVPIEAAFMLALQHDANLYKDAYDRQIILASPTTLLAILRTVENIWRYEKQNRNAERIAKDAGGLHDQFVGVLEALDQLGQQLDKTRDAYDKTHKRLHSGRGNLLRRVDTIRRLGAKTKKTIDPALLDMGGEEQSEVDTSDE